MKPIGQNRELIIADLKECERECRKRLFGWLNKTRTPTGIQNPKRNDLIEMFEHLPLWNREDAGGHALFRHKITHISVSFQAHGKPSLTLEQSKSVLDRIQTHVNILGNTIFEANRGWKMPLDFNKAYENYLRYTAKPNT